MPAILPLRSWFKLSAPVGVLLLLLAGMSGCGDRNRTADKLAEDSASAEQKTDTRLTFNDVTLEQADDDGTLQWTVQAGQVVYSRDKKLAELKAPNGEIFQDKKLLIRFKAKKGRVEDDGKRLVLEDDVIATQPQEKDGLIFRGQDAVWLTEKEHLVVNKKFQVANKQVRGIAEEGTWFSKKKRIEARKKVVAISKDPNLQFKGDLIEWQIDKQKIISNRPVDVARYDAKTKKITDTATGKRAEADLKAKTVLLQQEGRLRLSDPPLKIASDRLLWQVEQKKVISESPVRVDRVDATGKIIDTATGNRAEADLRANTVLLQQQGRLALSSTDPPLNIASDSLLWHTKNKTLTSDTPVEVLNRRDNYIIRGDRGNADLATNIFTFLGNVRGLGGERQSRLASNRLIWHANNNRVEAYGNVFYRQEKPPLVSRGPKALGFIKDGAVVMDGGRVTSHFIPEPNRDPNAE